MTNPYADTANQYWAAGWRGILPLPHAKKKNPPAGYTGSTGTDPAYPDVYAWADGTDGPRNICLRMPPGVIGIDVDAYGEKSGAATLATREAEWGPLPATWRTTSRDDGISGIRLFRIPEGLAWPGVVGPGIETVRRDHRYAVVWPSIHPEGGTYRWIDPDGIVTTHSIPDPDTLPALPHTWVIGLTGGEAAAEVRRNSHNESAAMLWIASLPDTTADPCTRMRNAAEATIKDIPDGAHDAATAGVARLLRYGSEHHKGVITAIQLVKAAFIAETTNPARSIAGKTVRGEVEAEREWSDIVRSGVNLISANPSPLPTCDCDGTLTDIITGADRDSTSGGTPKAEAHAQLKDGAAFILDAPATPPALWGYDTEVLWAEGESLMIAGPPGVGKTTLTGQLLRARLGLQEALLGWGVSATGSSVLYLAMDRPAQIARSLRRHFDESDREVLSARLKVWEGPPPADVATNTHILHALATLAGADTIIVDSVKDAAIGLTEDETAAGYNRARQYALARGTQIVELHHLVKRGPNGAAPKQLADVYGSAWLTAGAGSVLLLWGQAGDPVVQLAHLKQPMEDVGPLTLIHDHTAGETSIDTGDSHLPSLLTANAAHGLTAKAAAVHLFGTDNPTKNQAEKARRRLEAMVKTGDAVVEHVTREGRGSRTEARYYPPETTPDDRHADRHAPPHDTPEKTTGTLTGTTGTQNTVSAGQDSLADRHDRHADVTAARPARVSPPLGGYARAIPVPKTPQDLIRHCPIHNRDYVTTCPDCQTRTAP